METSVTIYWMALNFRYVPEKGKKGKRREHIPLAEGWVCAIFRILRCGRRTTILKKAIYIHIGDRKSILNFINDYTV